MKISNVAYAVNIILVTMILIIMTITEFNYDNKKQTPDLIKYISGDTLSINGSKYIMKKATNLYYLEKVR